MIIIDNKLNNVEINQIDKFCRAASLKQREAKSGGTLQ
jgi:hypothetical protein